MNPRVLVITAECGESQFTTLCNKLRHQVGVTIHHEVISDQTTINAERLIFETALNAKKKAIR